MKIYRGYGGPGHHPHPRTRVTVQADDGPERELYHYVSDSPSGFSWGFCGAGPTDLARSILAEHFGVDLDKGDLPVDDLEFRDAVVSKWPWREAQTRQLSWSLTSDEIDSWAAR
jgi:hypothetical protein